VKLRILAAAMAVALIGGTLTDLRAEAADSVAIRLDWTSWGSHAPYHLAAAKGWFKEAGLDVSIEDGNGSVTTVQIVGGGEFDLGQASLAPMAIARSKGLPVKAIAAFARQNDIGLIYAVDSGIKTIADLKGKTLVYTPGSLETPFLDSFLAAGGLQRGDVNLLSVEASAKGGTVMMGRADGGFSSIPFLQPIVATRVKADSLRFADVGLSFPSFGLFATEEKLKEKGDVLRRFASVVAGAWTYILDGHQDEAVKAIMDARPQNKLDPKILRQQIDLLSTFFVTPATQGKPLGTMAAADWQQAIEVLSSGGLVEGKADPAAFWTNDYLDPALIQKIADK